MIPRTLTYGDRAARDVSQMITEPNALTGTGAVGVLSPCYVVTAPFTAGVGNAADDVVITTNVPAACRIVDVKVIVTTVGAGDTVTLRDTAGGAGTALSDAVSTTNAGVIPWGVTALPAALAAGSAVYLRRTDNTTAGTVVITTVPV